MITFSYNHTHIIIYNQIVGVSRLDDIAPGCAIIKSIFILCIANFSLSTLGNRRCGAQINIIAPDKKANRLAPKGPQKGGRGEAHGVQLQTSGEVKRQSRRVYGACVANQVQK